MDIGKISAKELCARYPTTNHRRRWRPMKRGNRVMLEHFDFNQDIDWTKRAPGHNLQPNRPGALSSSVLCWEVWKLGMLRKNCGKEISILIGWTRSCVLFVQAAATWTWYGVEFFCGAFRDGGKTGWVSSHLPTGGETSWDIRYQLEILTQYHWDIRAMLVPIFLLELWSTCQCSDLSRGQQADQSQQRVSSTSVIGQILLPFTWLHAYDRVLLLKTMQN